MYFISTGTFITLGYLERRHGLYSFFKIKIYWIPNFVDLITNRNINVCNLNYLSFLPATKFLPFT